VSIEFDKTLKIILVDSEEEILGLNPTNGRSELIGEEFNENDICQLLTIFGRGPSVIFPLPENLVETW
jgi:hypothetical protein